MNHMAIRSPLFWSVVPPVLYSDYEVSGSPISYRPFRSRTYSSERIIDSQLVTLVYALFEQIATSAKTLQTVFQIQ